MNVKKVLLKPDLTAEWKRLQKDIDSDYSPINTLFMNIVSGALHAIEEEIDAPNSILSDISPLNTTSIIATNFVLNMINTHIDVKTYSLEARKDTVYQLADMIASLIKDSWEVLQTTPNKNSIPH